MPTYEYGCDGCGNQWELEQRISEDPVKKCPKCGKKKARRMISGGNFILKGSGWYADLYHKPSGKSASSAESGGDRQDLSNPSRRRPAALPARSGPPIRPAKPSRAGEFRQNVASAKKG